MITITETEVFGWKAAIRGMRNPMNSWDKSDSFYDNGRLICGETDLNLMKKLANAGEDHGKFLRFVNVTMDVNAPLYWWKEFDTYKVGTVANSCSTMHKIQAKEFELDDFSCEHLFNDYERHTTDDADYLLTLDIVIDQLNDARTMFLENKDKKYWWQLIQLLPSSYNQKRTIQLNYAVLKNIYHARKNHKLDEWHVFCDWILTLPYARELIVGEA